MDYNRMEIEYAIIGGLIRDASKLGQYLPELMPEDFRDVVCHDIYVAMRRMFNRGAPIDRLTVTAELGNDLARPIEEALRRAVSDLGYYVQMLKRMAVMDEANACGLAITTAETPEQLPELVDRLNRLLVTQRSRKAVTMAEAMQLFMDRHQGDPPKYLPWGIKELDENFFCEPGDFAVIGGYPSAGKTTLALQFARHMAKSYKVGFFSMETTHEKLADRIVSSCASVPLKKIKKNDFTDDDWRRMAQAAEKLSELPYDLIPAAGMTVPQIQAFSLIHRYQVIFVDYLQIVRDVSRGSRYEKVTNISMDFHTMAQSTGITVIALAQLSRPEKGKGDDKPKPPTMASFRESGQIEQDVDVALLLYQEDPNDYRSRRVLKVAKNKDGERTRIMLDFSGEMQRFSPAQPTPAESYAAVQKACAKARREAEAKDRIPGQAKMEDLPDDAGGELPFKEVGE